VKIKTLERRQCGGQRSSGGLGCCLHGWWRLYLVGNARAGDFSANSITVISITQVFAGRRRCRAVRDVL
jgi:hypothetical protein